MRQEFVQRETKWPNWEWISVTHSDAEVCHICNRKLFKICRRELTGLVLGAFVSGFMIAIFLFLVK